MATFEHAMLGANGVVASGLHHRFGGKLVVLATIAAIVPDWDGLTVLVDARVFDPGHAASRPGLRMIRQLRWRDYPKYSVS